MIVFPNCKINIGLRIVRKRDDGYHDLETIFYPIAITDALEIAPSDSLQFSLSGLPIDGPLEKNTCVRAYELLRNDFPDLPVIHTHLHKVIPPGSGLGGGSSDGAFMLSLINERFELGLSVERLIDYAIKIGSDCPFFIVNNPCFGSGRGEQLEAVPLDLSGLHVAVICPGFVINTRWAFEQVVPSHDHGPNLKNLTKQPVATWKHSIVNDFETAIFPHYPDLKQIKEALYNNGALYASLSGSGSAVYGIFDALPQLDSFPAHYFVRVA